MSKNYTTVEINKDGSFCTMLPPFGSKSIQYGASAALSYCFEGVGSNTTTYTNTDTHLVGPSGFILSANYAEDLTKDYRQITGCIDGSVLDLNSTDEGGRMDSVEWPYTCLNYKKFVSLIMPDTNQYCIRCCNGTNSDSDCDN
ncbi:hypothetical protein BGX26_007697, partial [Mortierella sp. AD094]